MHEFLTNGAFYGAARQMQDKAMFDEIEEEVRPGLAGFALGFLGDLMWEMGQIGQALLDGLTVLLLALLIYQHGAVLNAARPVDRASVAGAMPCIPGSAEVCIQAQVLQPSPI